nr:immunoglobulin heavy chain junction region [Macaca mulatta]MOW98651.1 immunoglobulin heavy chain junction region [Macaca mulatta]MOW98922.1 immunoglobulin heavy chain junction region [Macaca mulatta]MOW99032.1 immunoglobulin heavy chain junction region [Macaca mulatta]MOW99150.1 immunoglobulin heavy chain junction region [Macaca mulatta]
CTRGSGWFSPTTVPTWDEYFEFW